MGKKSFSKLSSDTISALRFPLMVGIVFIHFGVLDGIKVQGVVYGANPPFWLQCINIMFSKVIPTIGVPLFFVISGYLFFLSGLSLESYKKKLRKRVRTLLVPYIIWNALALLYSTIRALPCFSSIFPNMVEGDWSWQNLLASFIGRYNNGVFFDQANIGTPVEFSIATPQDVPMWYVRNLMVAALLSPIFYVCIKKCKGWIICVLGIVWLYTASNKLFVPSQLFTTSFFFSWGAYYAISGKDFVVSFHRLYFAPYLYAVVAIADMLTKEWEHNGYIHNAGLILGIFTAVSLTATLLDKRKIKVNKFLADSSFFLFALHIIFIGDVGKILVKIAISDNYFYMAFLYFLVPTTTILICLALYWLLQRFTPRFCALLTGGR